MSKGAFQVSREIFENPIWSDIPKFRIFFYIVGQAVFSPEGIRKGNVHIKRGQYLRSYRNLCDDLEYIENRKVKKYSVSVISRKIEQLVKEDRLKVEDTELGTLFTVVNYELYQGLENYKNKELGTELEQSRNNKGTELEQKRNNNKNVNKEKNVKNDKKKYKDYVYLTDSEYENLVNEFGQATIDSKIEDLDNYIGSIGKPNKYKDHNRTIRAWIKKDNGANKKTQQQDQYDNLF